MKINHVGEISVAALLLGLGALTPAQAQTGTPAATDDRAAPNEIIVTARLRNESLRDVPMMIETFSAQRLSDINVRDIADFIGKTPNISITQAQNVGTQFVTVRGISQVRNGESPVAIVVDGVQQVSPAQFGQNLFDLQGIEVVTGPQGALYGRNAIGGAIIINTRQPTDTLSGSASVSGGNGNDYRGYASISGPLTSNIKALVAGSYRDFGGYYDNIYLNKKQDPATEASIRGIIHADVASDLTAIVKVQYNRATGGALNYQYQATNTLPGNPCFVDPANPFDYGRFDANDVSRTFCSKQVGRAKRKLFNTSLNLTYEADFGTIRNIIAYDYIWNYYGGTQAPYLASINSPAFWNGTATQFERVKAISNEFRITSKDDVPLRWMVGAYYLDTRRVVSITTGVNNDEGVVTPVYLTPVTTGPNPTSSFSGSRNHNIAAAFFGNVSYDITEKLELAAALRYDIDQRRQFVLPYQTAAVPDGCTITATGNCTNKASYNLLQPKVSARYKITPAISIFTDWGVGFRSGQFNPNGTAIAAADAGILGVTDELQQEEARTVEAGFKAEFLNRTLRVNGTWYSTIDKNSLYYLFFAPTSQQILVNIDKIKNSGYEFQVNYHPVRELELFGSFGATRGKIRSYAADPTAIGNRAPYIPKNTWSAGAITHLPLNNAFGLFGRADIEGHGSQYWDPQNTSARKAYQLVNLAFGVEGLSDTTWSLTANVNNVFDKEYNAEFVSGGYVQPAIPRNWNVELKYKF